MENKKQHIVSRSSVEAEYKSMAVTLCDLKWLWRLLHGLRAPVTRPILLHCDNQVAIYITANPIFHERTKHIEIDCHFVQNGVQAGIITPSYIRSDLQPAYIFNKALHPS